VIPSALGAAAHHQAPSDHRSRTSRSLPEEQYSLSSCIAYCLYPPLYIAGPIMTFNDFMWQVALPAVPQEPG
jgi:D-alanyl-lipoteichoic acid acyltransferase DltB (MBOAT superfamily)